MGAGSIMCAVCEASTATVFCFADDAAMCGTCNVTCVPGSNYCQMIHAVNGMLAPRLT